MVGIDIRFMSENMKNGIISSGVGLFCADILDGIIKNNSCQNFCLIIDHCQKRMVKDRFKGFSVLVSNNIQRKGIQKGLYFLDNFRYNLLLKKVGINVVWYPFASPNTFRFLCIPSVSTIHDLIPLHENPNSLFWKFGFKMILMMSKKVITDTHYIKKDILNTFSSVYKSKINVIPCPITVNTTNLEPLKQLEGKPYILDVNAFQKRKNAVTLLKAYIKSNLINECDLVFCGGYNENGYLEFLKERVIQLGISDKVHFYLSLPVSQKDWLIKNAKILVSPSSSEGFGKTPIEALMMQVPVITSSVDPFSETTKGYAVFYDGVYNVDDLSKKLVNVFFNPPSFSIRKKAAEDLMEIYDYSRISKQYMRLFRKWF